MTDRPNVVRVSPDAGTCVHSEVCGIRPQWVERTTGTFYCVLHLPTGVAEKDSNAQPFIDALRNLRAEGRCDFRWIIAPRLIESVSFEREHFTDTTDLRFTSFPKVILSDARLDGGIMMDGTTTKTLYMERALVAGSITIDGAIEELHMTSASVRGDITVRSRADVRLTGTRASFFGTVDIHAGAVNASIEHSTFEGSFRVRGYIPAQNWSLRGATFHRAVDFSTCRITGVLRFTEVVFKDAASLLLAECYGMDGLLVDARELLPREIVLTGIQVGGDACIAAALGMRAPMVVAETPPRFQGKVTFSNANLGRCRLLGNDIAAMRLENITWPRSGHRFVLYDEIGPHERGTLPYGNLREAYQILKEKYRTLGDHVRSGDFHYGEMEVKRREGRRMASPEFLYWALSGYGTRYPRALAILVGLIVACGFGYRWLAPDSFAGGFLDALRFSLRTAAFQHPEPPGTGLGAAGEWLYVSESILGPIQIALLALALRMRLRR